MRHLVYLFSQAVSEPVENSPTPEMIKYARGIFIRRLRGLGLPDSIARACFPPVATYKKNSFHPPVLKLWGYLYPDFSEKLKK